MKSLLKRIFPVFLLEYFRELCLRRDLKKSYNYDYRRHLRHSVSNNRFPQREQLLSRIILEYHSVEKGLTMPEPRVGFGQKKIIDLCRNIIDYIKEYSQEDTQIQHSLGVIKEYVDFHLSNGYKLDSSTDKAIKNLFEILSDRSFPSTSQVSSNRSDYFAYSNSNFFEFSKSRRSLRSLKSVVVPLEKVTQVLSLAATTPSSCNRQPWRTYNFTNIDKISEILELQGGNRGFGHLVHNLIVIAASLYPYNHIQERNQAFIDGGMYAMNLLYSFHFYQLGACILNCSGTPEKDKRLRELCGIPDSEVMISIIIYGEPTDTFKTPISKRFNFEQTNKWT